MLNFTLNFVHMSCWISNHLAAPIRQSLNLQGRQQLKMASGGFRAAYRCMCEKEKVTGNQDAIFPLKSTCEGELMKGMLLLSTPSRASLQEHDDRGSK